MRYPASVGRLLAWLACAACSFQPRSGNQPDAPTTAGPDANGSDGGGDAGSAVPDAPPAPHVTIVQSAVVHPQWTQSDSSLAATLPAAVAAGHVLAVVLSWDDAHSLKSLGDSAGDTFHGPQEPHDTTNNKYLFFAFSDGVTGGSPVVTAVFNGSVTGRMRTIVELAGASPTAPLDASTLAQGSAGTATDGVVAGTVATTVAGELVLAGTTETTGNGGEAIAEGTGATMVQNLIAGATGGDAFAVEAYELAPTGSASPAFTFSGSGAALCVAASFKP